LANSSPSAFRRTFILIALGAVALLAAMPAGARAQTVVSLTFDDGITSQYNEAVPRLSAHGMLGTFFINSGTVGTGAYYMNSAQVDQVSAAGHEIGGHTINHVNLTGPGVDIRHQICDDAAALRARGYTVVDFAYPYGAGSTNPTVRQTLADCGFIAARKYGNLRGPDCPGAGCPLTETIPPADPYGVNSRGTQLSGPLTLGALQQTVTQAENAGGGWVTIVFHEIDNSGGTDTVSPTAFNQFLDWLQPRAAGGTVVRTMRSVMEPPRPAPPAPPAPVKADKVTAFASLSARSVQDIDKLYVKASMIETGTLTARATVNVSTASRTYRFKTARRTARPRVAVKLRLKLGKKALRAAKRALRRHKRLKARITVTARDKAGNAKTAKRTVRLRR
jgi:peptidoglycan/xylan/chitin deacetylase (PgdA/CDA1 family)